MDIMKYWIDKNDIDNKAINSKFESYVENNIENIWKKLGEYIHNNYTSTLSLYTAYKLLEPEEFFYIFNLSYSIDKYKKREYLIFNNQFYVPFTRYIINQTMENFENELFAIDIPINIREEIIKNYKSFIPNVTYELHNCLPKNFKYLFFQETIEKINKIMHHNNGFMDFNELFKLIYKMHTHDLEVYNFYAENNSKIIHSKKYKNILKNTVYSKCVLDIKIFNAYLFKIYQ